MIQYLLLPLSYRPKKNTDFFLNMSNMIRLDETFRAIYPGGKNSMFCWQTEMASY